LLLHISQLLLAGLILEPSSSFIKRAPKTEASSQSNPAKAAKAFASTGKWTTQHQ
jgi:hypothetical protein